MTRTIPGLDPAWAAQIASFCAEAYVEQFAHISAAPEHASQVDYVLAADYALDGVLVRYALGAPLDEVREGLVRAAEALAEVFRRRGTTPAFSVEIVAEGTAVPASSPGACDFSLTNSRRGLLAMYLALAIDNRSLAEEIAGLVGDPQEADYIGPDSDVCTLDEQQLAYALKSLLLGQDAVAAFYSAGVGHQSPSLRDQAAAVSALVGRDPGVFLSALCSLLVDHAAEASEESNSREPRRLICLPALGLAALGITFDMVVPGVLPAEDVYLPLELLLRKQRN